MKDFDVQINMNGVENELNSNFVDLSRVQSVSVSQLKDMRTRNSIKPMEIQSKEQTKRFSRFEGETTTDTEEDKKSWIDTLNTLTNTFKEVTGYQTNEQAKAKREKELAEKGTKYRVLGMNPFVAIAVSLVVIIGGSVAITKIKAG
jgi:tRNA U34 2-thiouridine synthase MnmA/TrmU